MNFIYKYNEDGSIDNSYEIKKIYLMIVLPMLAIYFLNINPSFNQELNQFLSSFGMNIWGLVGLYIALGYFVFRFADKHFKVKKFKKIHFNNEA